MFGIQPRDLDLLIPGMEPKQVERIISKTGRWCEKAKGFPVIRSVDRGRPVEISMPRGHGQEAVESAMAANDFTINSCAKRIASGAVKASVVQHEQRLADIKGRVLRSSSDPASLPERHPLALVRGPRLAAQLDLTIEPETLEAMRQASAMMIQIPSQRRAQEMLLLLNGKRWQRALEQSSALLPEWLPFPEIQLQGMAHGGPDQGLESMGKWLQDSGIRAPLAAAWACAGAWPRASVEKLLGGMELHSTPWELEEAEMRRIEDGASPTWLQQWRRIGRER